MAISHRTNRLKLIGTPSVEQLQNGRYKLTITCSSINSREDWYSSNKARIFPDFGSLESAEMSIDGLAPRTGEAYTDMRLTEVQSGNRSPRDGSDYIVVLTYETIGNSFVQVKDDTVSYTESGLRRVIRQSIAKAGTDFQKTVGITSITSQIDNETGVTCFLASYEVDDTDSYREVTEVYIEAGTLSETKNKVGSQLAIVKETFASTPSTPSGYLIASEQESNVSGIPTKRFTFLNPSVLSRSIRERNGGAGTGKLRIEVVEAFGETPSTTISGVQIGNEVSDVEGIPTRRFTFAKGEGQITTSTRPGRITRTTEVTAISYGIKVTPSGVPIFESETQEDGYVKFTVTCIQGTIVEQKTTYKDVVQVDVPGEVDCTNVSVSSGAASGDIAVPKVTPRKRKSVGATVTIEVTNDPPDTASVAYDLGEISCSVTSTNVSLTRGPGTTATTMSGNNTMSLTGFTQNFGASARIQTYPGCFLTSASSSGSIDYTTAETPKASGNTLVMEIDTSSRNTTCAGTGATSKVGYVETGIIKRNSRPIVTALNGTTYYEVITWSV
jgi:hypothetical protein